MGENCRLSEKNGRMGKFTEHALGGRIKVRNRPQTQEWGRNRRRGVTLCSPLGGLRKFLEKGEKILRRGQKGTNV